MTKTVSGRKIKKAKVSRAGIHAKSKMSVHKSSKHYVKLSRGQGK